MKILLACSAGTSTSLVVSALEKYWKENNIIGNEVEALGVAQASIVAKEYDVILLGPQVRFQLTSAKSWVVGTNIPVAVMEPRYYALANALEIYKQAQELFVKNKKG